MASGNWQLPNKYPDIRVRNPDPVFTHSGKDSGMLGNIRRANSILFFSENFSK
jgi:hypothetical protein